MLASKTLAFAVLVFLTVCAGDSRAAETYLYQLIPGKNTIRYAETNGGTTREMYAGLIGRFGFQLNDDETITAQLFDLTLQGPFFDDVLGPVDWAPFAPGDMLADLLAVDFAASAGIAVPTLGLNGNPPQPPRAYIGPAVNGDLHTVFLGVDYYGIQSLAANPSLFELQAQSQPEIGGIFNLFPPGEAFPPSPDGTRNLLLRLLPNVIRIPEPSVAPMLVVGAVFVCWRSMR